MILITGAGGMIGSHMIEYYYNNKIPVIGTYYKPTTNINELPQEVPMFECDIRYPNNIEKIIFEYKPDTIFHLAAQSYSAVSWDKPYETIDTNGNGTIAVFEAIKKLRKVNKDYDPMVVVACSSAEYGDSLNNLTEPVKEDAALLPLHPYGVSKVCQDLLSYQYFRNDNIKCIRARIFNSTGTRKVGDVTSDFTKRAALIKINNTEPLLTVGNIETKRAIMDVEDLISALILLSEKGTPGDVYNISSEHVYKISEIITLIEDVYSVKYKQIIDEKLIRPTDEKIIVGNADKLKALGWKQKVTLKETVSKMLKYWEGTLGNN